MNNDSVDTKNAIVVRKALATDVKAIHKLLEFYADQGIVLRRSEKDILFYIKNFTIAECNGELCGCVAMRFFGNSLYEVRSLAVATTHQRLGIGSKLIARLIKNLTEQEPMWRLFTLTGNPKFFIKQGFKLVDRSLFPEKIWSDCAMCPKNSCCDEIALEITSNDIAK